MAAGVEVTVAADVVLVVVSDFTVVVTAGVAVLDPVVTAVVAAGAVDGGAALTAG